MKAAPPVPDFNCDLASSGGSIMILEIFNS